LVRKRKKKEKALRFAPRGRGGRNAPLIPAGETVTKQKRGKVDFIWEKASATRATDEVLLHYGEGGKSIQNERKKATTPE